MNDIHQILTRYWGYSSFRPLQDDIIHSVLQGHDTLALMPTGGGKSICFQVPGLYKEGTCLVVSPLIALIKDQVENLHQKKISAIGITSAMDKRQIDIALDNCVYGKVKFLYVSPERLASDIFIARVQKMNINLLAIDEAHCISQWGYDFRPSYLKIADIRQYLPNTPILALTASATIPVVADIQEKLEFKKKKVFKKSFERKNISYVVLQEPNKLTRLLKIIAKVKGTGIVYVRSRKRTEDIASFLRKNQVVADHYHAGLTTSERERKQENWIRNKTRIIVATNAFGMGIDKPDVRLVVHMDIPDTLEAYYQEAGRAGRDEKKGYAVLMYDHNDIESLTEDFETTFPPLEDVKNIYQCLANYYQMPVGSGKDAVYDFDLADFSNRYGLNALGAFNGLKQLEREGYIALTEGVYQPATLHIIVDRDTLYNYQLKNEKADIFIKLLLRSYAGLFEGYIKINERELARRLHDKWEYVVSMLNQLQSHGIVDYKPQSDSARLTFVTERIDNKNLSFNRLLYKKRKDDSLERIRAIIHYVKAKQCRSRLILNYFGETDSYRCGICDYCLEQNKLEMSDLEFENISTELRMKLAEETTIEELLKKVNYPEPKLLKVIRWYVDQSVISHNENKFRWNEGK